MEEAFIQLLCPSCDKAWESTASDLPSARESFQCPACASSRRTAEFMRTDRDLQTLKLLG